MERKIAITLSANFHIQVTKSVEKQGMNISQACASYYISKITLNNWLKEHSFKLNCSKTPNEALLKNIKQHSKNTFIRVKCFNYSK